MEVIVVSADSVIRASLSNFFRRQEFEVKSFATPKDASSSLGSEAVLVAEHSTEVDAGELLGKAGCTLLMVAPERAKEIEELKKKGADDAFIAPVAPGQLVEALNRYIDSKEGLPFATKVLNRSDVESFVSALLKKRALYAPIDEDGVVKFDAVTEPTSVKLAYTSTILPPKKLFQPTKETILRFNRAEGETEVPELSITPKTVLGIHPCDMQGILRTDWAFTETNPEENYINRRKETVFIGVTCVPDESCFCSNLGTYNTREGFDAFIVDLGDKFVVEILTDRGKELLSDIDALKDATEEDIDNANKKKSELSKPSRPVSFHSGLLPQLMAMTEDDTAFWKEIANRCYSCGTCTLVCPSCYCFDVEDDVSLSNLAEGERIRLWDSCQQEGFAIVATGENFREDRANRVKHRVYRKYYYTADKFGDLFCVGCGRCARQCTAKIHDIVSDLNERYALTLSDIAAKAE